MKNIFYLKIFNFLVVKFSIYLNRRVFVMEEVLYTLSLLLPEVIHKDFAAGNRVFCLL